MRGLIWVKAGYRRVAVYFTIFYSDSAFTKTEIAKIRLCLTHVVSSNLWRETRRIYISHCQHVETGIVPKSFTKKFKRDPDHIGYMRSKHTCCSVNIHILNSFNNCSALKTQIWGKFSVCIGKSHNQLWNVYRDWYTDRPVKMRLNIVIVVSDVLDNLPNFHN